MAPQVDSSKEQLPEIFQGYDAKNLDETGCFWKALPESGFARKCHGKKSKQRFTVALIKEMPIVIWKSEKPRCFKGVNVHQLPVQYFNQKKAWMTGEIWMQS